MGVSTDGILFFGYCFTEEDEHPLPLGDDHEDEDDWWFSVRGYVPLHKPYTEDGKDYAPGFTEGDPRIPEQWNHENAWEEENPLPVDVVRHCSDNCTMYGLAVKGTESRARRGCPEPIDIVTPDQKSIDALIEFCREFGVDVGDQVPRWWLTSMWW